MPTDLAKWMTTPSKPPAEPIGASPSASGPAGALFEGQVAAHYLLTMLAEADPRGLPGITIERVELQRAGEGHPLDDVIVRGATREGEPAVLEVQVKRTITFAPGDSVFKDVVGQLAQAFKTLDLADRRHQFAVATERTSFKITGPYQDVLRWAREVDSATVFFDRINRKKVGNDDMRTFVSTVQTHLKGAGCSSDQEIVWQLLRRFQILTFDYDAPGSQSIELAIERARNLLEPADVVRASAFWEVLTAKALRVASSGGDLDRAQLTSEIASFDGFRLLGSRRNLAPRETLAEAAGLATASLRRSIAGVTLTRSTQLDAIRECRDHGRYVEIRGGPGVGKSGLLGMLVDHVLTEGRAIVLTPERTIPGGWVAFKSALKIDVGPEAFLSDLASDGGAVLFIDSLDFFDDPDKRATVIDLARAAAAVPAFEVIITARTDFDEDEPNWLPADALARLGCARPVILDELGPDEIEDLRAGASTLRALLADDHPARVVARNLFRLSRLLEVQGSTDQLRSEVDLLERWWKTADGPIENRRERARLLADLADVIIAGADRLEFRGASTTVNALVGSGTLRDLGLDRFAFRHDVLREWGVSALLHHAPDRIDDLPLTRAAPASMARSVELAARFALERSEDGQKWLELLSRVSLDNAHVSWRRWSLLAILRSELVFTLLDRASTALMDRDGTLLRELIRTTIAAESRPLAEALAEFGVDAKGIPIGIYGPINRSWRRLASWLVARRATLPLRALPDIVELFLRHSASMFFRDSITPEIAVALAEWLEEIEVADDDRALAPEVPRFASAFRHYDLRMLGEDVRRAFFLMAFRVPEQAQDYLRRLLGRQNQDELIREVIRFRGSLAQAAPAELVDITLAGLIPTESRERGPRSRGETFTHLDSDFLPSSPFQGPFLDLLNAAPVHGVDVIRRLVDYAITAKVNGREPDDDGFTLVFPTGPRFFPWARSYSWSRDADGCYAVESGLLALEAWAHARIESGASPEQVIADVLGADGSPAAFVLVAVDVLISHWPKTANSATPFLASPELLSLDRMRQARDQAPMINLRQLTGIGPNEPAGADGPADLENRPSRRNALEVLLPTFMNKSLDRDFLHDQLASAVARLGSLEPDDNFTDPRLMARYALNVIDPANWPSIEGRRDYVSPPEEAQHIEALQKKDASRMKDFGVDLAIQNALENPAQSSAELAEHAVAYAQRFSAANDTPEDALISPANAIVSAAMILVRDGLDALLDQYEGWARDAFAQAFGSPDKIASGMREGIRFNPVAIATLGCIYLWGRRGRQGDRDALLELAGRSDPHAAQGFGAGLSVIREMDARLVPALLRCALAAQIRPRHHWDDAVEIRETQHAKYRESVTAAICAEVNWLNNVAPEPVWPPFPPQTMSIRRSFRVGRTDDTAQPAPEASPAQQLQSQSAALWLRQVMKQFDAADLGWIGRFVDTYIDWTAASNGSGLELDVQLANHTGEWNSVFFTIFAHALARMDPDEAAARVAGVVAVPDESFFDVASDLVPAIDQVYFNGQGLDLGTALRLRALMVDRMVATRGWRHGRDTSDLSVEMHIGPAVAALFFNQYNSFNGASCYLLPLGIEQLDPFLPELVRLVDEGPVPFCAILAMNLLEVSPRPGHLSFLMSSVQTWLQRQPANTRLWVDSGLGARVAAWLERALRMDTTLGSASHPSRAQIDDVLARLVQGGVAQAHRVETLFSARPA